MKQKNTDNSKPALIYSCSGASDVGELTDRTARRIARSGSGKMTCLAGIGGRVQHFLDDAQSAEEIVIIDGCSHACARKTLNAINIQGYEIDLEALGFPKGKTPATGANINKVMTLIKTKLGYQ